MARNTNSNALDIAKSVASYTLLPDFWSRLVGFMPQFGLLAYLMAVTLESLRLIPRGHNVLDPKRIGQFRVRDVLAIAANNLHGGLRNSDQYIVFGVFVLGTVLLALQFLFIFFILVTRTAEAAIPFSGMFYTAQPETDIAHLLLDRVFGIPGFFNSCFDPIVNAAPVCAGYIAPVAFPDSTQSALQALFRFYSMGMMGVAGFVVVYFIFVMIVETVNTGVPFGHRFQSIFTPMRLVIAVLLLLPLAYGYNTGQYIVLIAAKWGSGLATNSWLLFNNRVGSNPMGMEPQQLIGSPKIGEIESVINFMYLAQTCRAAYGIGVEDKNNPAAAGQQPNKVQIKPYLVRAASSINAAGSMEVDSNTTFDDARTFYGEGDVRIVFGEKNDAYVKYAGVVKPYCGVLVMPALSKQVSGIQEIYNIYFSNVRDIWFNQNIAAYGTRMACVLAFSVKSDCAAPAALNGFNWEASDNRPPGQGFYISVRQAFEANFKAEMAAQIANLRGAVNPQTSMDAKTLELGWGGAGVWFNKIMSYNGALVDVILSLPTPTQYPMVMEHISKKKRQLSPNTTPKDLFTPTLPSGVKDLTMDKFMGDSDLAGDTALNVSLASLFNTTYEHIQNTEATTRPKTGNTDSPVKNFVTMLFGKTGLFDFRANSEVFPLAKMAILGREIIDKTAVMLAATTLMSGVGGFVGADLGPMGDMIKGFGPGIKYFATAGFSIGILLYYAVPLMPFIYFFFGVGRWVKSIFEAMVAIPLWALAHLRLGGDGIPGPMAAAGYFLILEIFLRPIFTLFGLMCSIATFMALTYGLDSVFNLAVTNAGGFDMTTISAGGVDNFASSARDGLDALFYTVLYAILVYMIATSSFKLIDLIPNAVMRWGGTNTAAFDDKVDPIGQINYNLVYKADSMARDITKAGDNFEDASRLRGFLAPGKNG